MTVMESTHLAITIANEISATTKQVNAAIELLDAGNTVPFIARYRKEVTGGLDDSQLRMLEERLIYLRELNERRDAILLSISEQGKLTPELKAQLDSADTKQKLEDLYLPYRPKRRTRAQIAREAGLSVLAETLLRDPGQIPENIATAFIDESKGVGTIKVALDGARDILAEQFSEDAVLLETLRLFLWKEADVVSQVLQDKCNEAVKFQDYFNYREPVNQIPSHRALALFRGRTEGFLTLKLSLDEARESQTPHPCQAIIARCSGIESLGRPADAWLNEVCRWTWRVKLALSLENEIFAHLNELAQNEAINIFGKNLRDLLLAAPAGQKTVMGLDPGIRTGVKVAVISPTGKALDTAVIYPHEPHRRWNESLEKLAYLSKKYDVSLIAIGNGTASRETDALVVELMTQHPSLKLSKVVVSEAGASVYSASKIAAEEFPNMDVSYRGAVSIARRLQDPLAELVKIDPKAIGVGQYQHDVNQSHLARKLDTVVEDCVNAVGVDLNTASASLLARVSGVTPLLAQRIVSYRDEHGPFATRDTLLAVPRCGEKAFKLAAGFLRIPQGNNPLDASAVHPEAYPVVQKIAKTTGVNLSDLVGNASLLRQLDARQFTDDRFGLPTVRDILAELEKPGRDPRPEFKTVKFSENVCSITDLKPGLLLEGVVSNVAAFGAFVDIGVHQDGLVHISELADRYIDDPNKVVRVGDIVTVRVLDVDVARKRIALSMKNSSSKKDLQPRPKEVRRTFAAKGIMASAFEKLKC